MDLLTVIITAFYGLLLLIFLNGLWFVRTVKSSNPRATRSFLFAPKQNVRPRLILIAGCTGTGKSTFGMSVALSQSVLKCISTDTIREVTRTSVSTTDKAFDAQRYPALMRSSYEGSLDPVVDWKDSCQVLDSSVEALVNDAMNRGTSLVLEGVHIQPKNDLLDRWRDNGGTALGCLLMISDAEAHRSLIFRRGEITKKGEEKKINAFTRIRAIQDEMVRMATANDWLLIGTWRVRVHAPCVPVCSYVLVSLCPCVVMFLCFYVRMIVHWRYFEG